MSAAYKWSVNAETCARCNIVFANVDVREAIAGDASCKVGPLPIQDIIHHNELDLVCPTEAPNSAPVSAANVSTITGLICVLVSTFLLSC